VCVYTHIYIGLHTMNFTTN